mgnify:CR=1 FL=1
MAGEFMFDFKIIAKDLKSRARVGEIHTPHGMVETPAFVPVGTRASVRGLSAEDLKEIGVQILFGNTYHLHLKPGEDVVEDFGGLGKFMNWDGPTITDSGGFQVFSLGQAKFESEDGVEDKLVKIKEGEVVFRSHIDGSLHTFTPEKSIEIQHALGADIILCFDECAPHPSTHEYTKAAMERTHRWALRCLEYHKEYSSSEALAESRSNSSRQARTIFFQQALYGIIQGGVYEDLRIESAKYISSLPFDGIAIGGVSVGESKKQMRDVLKWVSPYLPEDKPRHLLGIGEIDDIFDAIAWGVDTFDCVIPTRFGRYGIVFFSPASPKTASRGGPPSGHMKNKFKFDLRRTIFATDKGPIDKNCTCYVCKSYTRGYLHHLFKVEELLAYRLASYHNVHFLIHLTYRIRNAILEGKFEELRQNWIGR